MSDGETPDGTKYAFDEDALTLTVDSAAFSYESDKLHLLKLIMTLEASEETFK